MDIVIRANEGCDDDPFLLWDSVWDPARGEADWAMAGADEPHNRGGLRAKAALATSVTIALFTDRRVDPLHPLAWLSDGDPRGWWGDGVGIRRDLGETELGSYLWLLERAPLTIDGTTAARWAEQFAREALAPLQAQGAVTIIEVEAEADELRSRLDLAVRLYGKDGKTRVFDRRFDVVWRQITG